MSQLLMFDTTIVTGIFGGRGTVWGGKVRFCEVKRNVQLCLDICAQQTEFRFVDFCAQVRTVGDIDCIKMDVA